VQPLPSPKNAPAYVDPRPSAELSLQPETNVAQIRPDVIPAFPERDAVAAGDETVLQAVNEWAAAWSRRDEDAYLAAYDASFVPQGGGSRADWEKRRRLLLGMAGNIDLKVDSPSVDRSGGNGVTVTFNQFYQSERYRDAVVKQLRMVERDGRWLIAEEKVVSILRGTR
jgi:ketosteroid isomerase-like protein